MNASRKKIVLLLVALSSLCKAVRADDRPLAVIELSDADGFATARIAELSERPRTVTRAEACDAACALSLGRQQGASDAVLLDSDHATVQVVRSVDGRVWTRAGDPATTTPLTLAFVAVELLALSDATPVAEDDAWGVRWLAIRTGVAAPVTRPYRGSVRPDLGLLSSVGRARSPWSATFEIAVAPGISTVRRVAAGRLQVRRTNLVARAGALFEHGRLALAGWGQIGAGLTRASWEGEHARADRGAGWVLGAGIEPNVRLSDWARLYASAQLAGAAPRKDYRAENQRILREPPLMLEVGLGLWFTLPVH